MRECTSSMEWLPDLGAVVMIDRTDSGVDPSGEASSARRLPCTPLQVQRLQISTRGLQLRMMHPALFDLLDLKWALLCSSGLRTYAKVGQSNSLQVRFSAHVCADPVPRYK